MTPYATHNGTAGSSGSGYAMALCGRPTRRSGRPSAHASAGSVPRRPSTTPSRSSKRSPRPTGRCSGERSSRASAAAPSPPPWGRAGGAMPLTVLDSTAPAAVAAVERDHPPAETLYLIATKSGTTAETLAFLAYFLERVETALAPAYGGPVERVVEAAHPGPERWVADHFAAITDPGESLERIPYSERFREVFLNPPDVGGRYGALSYVGLVPGALLGLDLRAILASAVGMAGRCRAPEADRNPGLALGLLMGSLARAGIDKLTLVLDPRIAALGPWIEQLVAESTGKGGTGIVPVDGEALGGPEAYGADRLFVAIGLEDGAAARGATEVAAAKGSDRRLSRPAEGGPPPGTVGLPDRPPLRRGVFPSSFS